MFATKLRTALFAVLVLVAAVGPAAAAGGQASSSVTATVHVTDEATLITVQEDGSAAANAEVTVSGVADGSLAASGTYTTDANGTVRLPAPDADTTIRLGVEHDAVQATATLRLQAPESGSWQTTVSLDAGATADTAGNAAVSAHTAADGEESAGESAEVQAGWELVGQFGFPFDLGLGARTTGDMGNDTAVAGGYDLEQSGNSSSGQAQASASGVGEASVDAEGEADQSENDSSNQSQMNGGVSVHGQASGDGASETSGGLDVGMTSSANGTSADAGVDIVGLGMDLQSQLALAMSSE